MSRVGPADPAAILALQREVGNRAVTSLIDPARTTTDPSAFGTLPRCVPGEPDLSERTVLDDYPYLKAALTADQYASLQAGAQGRGGSDRLAVPLLQLLPPDTAFRPRAQLLDDLYPQLASAEGVAPGAAQMVDVIARNETLRTYLQTRLRTPVTIVLGAPTDAEPVRFVLDGVTLHNDHGMIPVTALDQVSVATLASIDVQQQAAAIQLADLRLLQIMADRVRSETLPLAYTIMMVPADYAPDDVTALRGEVARLKALADQLRAGLHPANADRVGQLQHDLVTVALTSDTLRSARNALDAFRAAHVVDDTYGEVYEDAENEYAEDAGLSPSGVWAGLNWFATKTFHTVGNTVTAGHLDRQAGNARAYQDGHISWNAYQENEGWNIAKSLVVAAASALSAGLASRFAAGVFSVEAGYTASGAATLTGTVVGGAGSLGGALAEDATSAVAARATHDRYVRRYQTNAVLGPLGWLSGALGGAMVGGLFGRLFGGRSRSSAGESEEGVRTGATRTDVTETPPVGEVGGSAEPVAYVNGQPVKPTNYMEVFTGDDMSPQQVKAAGGFPARGDNWDLVNHADENWRVGSGGNDSAFRGATSRPNTPDLQQGAAQWGRWVYRIRGMPVWDVNQLTQGRVSGPGGFRGTFMSGEGEMSIPARVPLANIDAYAEVVERPDGGRYVKPGSWISMDTVQIDPP